MKACKIYGCEKSRHGRSQWCSMHEARIRRHGNPDVAIHQRDRALPSGENNPRWNQEPDYFTMHSRLRHKRGAARNHECACGAPARQWAYVGPRAPGERLPFSQDLSQYEPMCVPCHKQMDVDNIRSHTDV